ncbi:MAG TPA: molybdopterin-dependent oxidoreductase [Xanthobacteraceae bacterium]|nr:molybdopterin-dependent oxidoreductase [Xanthobacteraceae bacterium]
MNIDKGQLYAKLEDASGGFILNEDPSKQKSRPILNPVGLHRRIPLMPHQMVDRITRFEDFFSLIHLGAPRLEASDWSMTVGGMVRNPYLISFDELLRLPKTEITSVHQCAGNPMQPNIATRRVASVTWGGVDLKLLLDRARPDPAASFLWAFGSDYGDFDGAYCDEYGKDLPISRVREGDILVAYELNGRALPAENGFPARLVVPGFYGTNSVKWLTRIELADRRLENLFTTKYYNDTLADGSRRPVWDIPVESIIVSPAPDAALRKGEEVTIWGWAWASSGVESVEVFVDEQWLRADFEESKRAWSRFEIRWRPVASGEVVLKVKATSRAGHEQPEANARNAIHTVLVIVS